MQVRIWVGTDIVGSTIEEVRCKMGLTITGKYEESPSYDMGYVTFFRLRRDIAYTVSKEFGEHYSKMPQVGSRLIDVACYDLQTERLIKKYKCKERFLDFLYLPDTEGKLSPYKCKALLDQMKKAVVESDTLYGYTARPESCLTLKKFEELLAECWERKKYLVWY